MLFNISTNKWDDQILKILKIPKEILPVVKDCAADFGYTDPSITGTSYPITGMVGDQQSATIGQCCFEPGSLKSTYGTGAFVLLNTGSKRIDSKNGLITTLACNEYGKPTYAIEGSVFIGGSIVQWLRDSLKLIENAEDLIPSELSEEWSGNYLEFLSKNEFETLSLRKKNLLKQLTRVLKSWEKKVGFKSEMGVKLGELRRAALGLSSEPLDMREIASRWSSFVRDHRERMEVEQKSRRKFVQLENMLKENPPDLELFLDNFTDIPYTEEFDSRVLAFIAGVPK